jgi:hypothetical protein
MSDSRVSLEQYSVAILPGVTFPATTVFLNYPGLTVVISPGLFSKEQFSKHIPSGNRVIAVAPNALHHLHLDRFRNLYPRSEIYGPSLVEKKQPALTDKLRPLGELDLSEQGIESVKVEGNPLISETVFFLRAEATLVVTDLLFFMSEPMPWGRRMLLKTVGAYDKPSQSGLVKLTTKDKLACNRSIEKLLGFGATRLIVSHGNEITGESEVKSALQSILRR